MSTRSNRISATFPPLRSPSLTMRSLRSAFSPPRASRSASTTSGSSTHTTSPLTQPHRSGSHSRTSSPQSTRSRSAHSFAELLAARRRFSARDGDLDAGDLDVLEPRPLGEVAGVVGIFEVLDGTG
ncbi:hypothetical protein EJ07DRAFT_171640 [Lizonia empirigonia]|nr:hypothetical protein EJ07DRAFT_171640 [Lizonia empirigonia]